jgi:hypothetical protein
VTAAKHTPIFWQGSANAGKTWTTVTATKTERTVEARVAYLRTVKRGDGKPAYSFRSLYVGTPVVATAPDLLEALTYLRDCIECGREPAMGDVNRSISKATGSAS